jgi:hypothetical protein
MTHYSMVRCDSDQPGADRIMSSRWQAVCSLIDSFATLDSRRRAVQQGDRTTPPSESGRDGRGNGADGEGHEQHVKETSEAGLAVSVTLC